MTLKTLLVHLDHDDPAPRLALAVSLARRHRARLVGLFAERGKARGGDAAKAGRDAFARATEGLEGAEWREAGPGGPADVVRAVTEAARTADLVLLGQDDGVGHETHASVPAGMAEQVILGAGRPALVIPGFGPGADPGAGWSEGVGRRPLIAWNNSREAARALADALPLIAGAEEVVVATFVARPDEERASVQECLRHLADHGIRARSECLVVDGIGIMDMLLSRVGDTGADLLVMGAHSHYGFPHLLRGNGTRHVLSAMTVPVLMSN